MPLARARPEVPVAATDQDNLQLAQSAPGSLTAATLTQVITEQPDLRLVPLDGVLPSVEGLKSARYPFAKQLFLVVRTDADELTTRFVAFLASERGRQILRDAGTLP